MIAIGVLDTRGLVSAVEALDICLKTAEVRFVSFEKVGGGIISITVTGEVAAVASAVQAGVAAAERLGGYLSHTIIARIDEQTGALFEEPENATEAVVVAEEVAPEPEPELELEAAPEPEPKLEAKPETTPQAEETPAPQATPKPKPKPAKKPRPKKKN